MKQVLHTPKVCLDVLGTSSAFAWQHAPCAVVTRRAILPKVRMAYKALSNEKTPAPKGWKQVAKIQTKRPLRQRICRWGFREFLRSCDLSPRIIHLEMFTPWQVALGAGVFGAILMSILS